MKNVNIRAITNAINDAYIAVDGGKRALAAFKASVEKLRPLLASLTRDEAKAIVAPMWAKLYGETFNDGQWADSTCAAKRDCNRLLANIYPRAATSSPATSSKTVVSLTRAQKAAVKALLLAFGGDAKAAKAAVQ